MITQPLFFIVNNVLLLLLSSVIAFRSFKRSSLELTLLGSAVLFPTIILLIVLGMGIFDFLYNYLVTLVLLLVLMPVLAKSLFQTGRRFASLREYAPQSVPIALLLLAGAFGGYIAGRYVVTGTHFCFDDFTYHATSVGHWIKDRSLWSGAFNYHYHNPMNAEVLSFWWMLPFGQDGFAFLTGVYWLFLSGLAVFVLCGRLGVPLWVRFLIPLAVLASRVSFQQAAATFSGVDLAGPAMVSASVAFLSFRDIRKHKADPLLIIFSGLACGFAVGSKAPFATVAFLLAAWILLRRRKEYPLPDRLKDSVMFCSAVLLTGFFWYGKNIYLTGNPVFPGQLGIFDGPLTSDIQHSTKIIGLVTGSGFNLMLLSGLLRRHLQWPAGICMLSLMGYLGAAWWLALGKHGHKSAAQNGLLLLLAGIVMFLTYINMPFSGSANSQDSPILVSLRFVIGPFLVGIILYSRLMNLPGRMKWLFIILFIAAIAEALYDLGFKSTYAVAIVPIASAVAAAIIKPAPFKIQKSLTCVVSLCAGAFCGLAFTFPYQQKQTDKNVFLYKNMQVSNGLSWKQLEAFSKKTTCAALGPSSYQSYPLLGRQLQHDYRALDESGIKSKRLYERYQNDPEHTPWWPQKPKVIQYPQEYLQNATKTGVDCFFIIRYEDGRWPIEPDSFVEAGWKRVWEDAGQTLWKKDS